MTTNTPDYTALAERIEALPPQPYRSVFSEDCASIRDSLTYDQCCTLQRLLSVRTVRRAAEALDTTPAIRAYILAACDDPSVDGLRSPERRDLTYYARAARSTTDQYGKPRTAYRPDGQCPLRLKLADAVFYRGTQGSYADYSYTLVPVEGTVVDADFSVCQSNAARFVQYSNTHTGWAGSGCTHSARLHVTPLGAFVEIECRASIAD